MSRALSYERTATLVYSYYVSVCLHPIVCVWANAITLIPLGVHFERSIVFWWVRYWFLIVLTRSPIKESNNKEKSRQPLVKYSGPYQLHMRANGRSGIIGILRKYIFNWNTNNIVGCLKWKCDLPFYSVFTGEYMISFNVQWLMEYFAE